MTLHRLAVLFRRPVAEVDIDVDELAHWIAFEHIEPHEAARTEYMIAQLTALVAGMFSKTKPKPMDFMLSAQMEKATAEVRPQTFEDSIRQLFGVPAPERKK